MSSCAGKLYYSSLFIFFFPLIVFLFSCSTVTKSAKVKNGKDNTDNFVQKSGIMAKPLGEGTLLSLPGKNEVLEKMVNAVLSAKIYKASPKSLQDAILLIQNDSKGLTDENRFFLKLINDILFIVYPLCIEADKSANITEVNHHLLSLQKVKKGVYPIGMKKDSFLDVIIPALILVVKKDTEDIKLYYDEIEERLNIAKTMQPESVLPYYLLGILNDLKKDSISSAAFYKKAWLLDNSCYPAGLRYGKILTDMGNSSEAVQIADVISLEHKDAVQVQILYAEAYIADGMWNEAANHIMNVLKKEPDNISALLLRIKILIEQKEFVKANALLDAYATKNKTSKDYLLYRARVSREWNKNLDAAADFLSDAYKLYSDDFTVLLACAEICFETYKKIDGKDADFFLQTVLKQFPDNTAAISLLIKNNINTENWKDAVLLAERLVKKLPNDSNRILLITAYLGEKKYQEAFNESKTLYFSSKKPANIITKLYIESLYNLKNYQLINNIIEARISSADSELKSIFYYYNAKLVKNNSEEYLSALRASLLANPRNIDSLFLMYEWYLNIKDYRKAKYYLGQVIAIEPLNKKNRKLSEKLDALLAN